jgi:flavin reductase (DIM6/NTAB) family NADH-FMN oxidoreductase RutF
LAAAELDTFDNRTQRTINVVRVLCLVSGDVKLERGPIDGFALRSCLARFATGVAVVAADGPDGRVGLTVNSFTAVSLEPPLVVVSVHKQARSHDAFLGRPFAVSVLGAEHELLARHFAGRPQVADVPWLEGGSLPRLANSLAVVECAPWAAYDGGDHTLVVGEVTAFNYREGDALGYFCGRFIPLHAPAHGIEFLF